MGKKVVMSVIVPARRRLVKGEVGQTKIKLKQSEVGSRGKDKVDDRGRKNEGILLLSKRFNHFLS